jgi:hypothetical protein
VYEAGQTKPCSWNDLISLINNVLNFILFKLAIPIGAIMFCYAGFLLITSGGDTEARGTAKKNSTWCRQRSCICSRCMAHSASYP